MARELAWVASLLTIVGCAASPLPSAPDAPARPNGAASDGAPGGSATPMAAAAAIDAVTLPDEPEPALSMAALIAMGRPLPEDAPASMSLDPL
ncbi:MAG TPA: hypothetical protein VL400_16005, partial [Polyangiaceae bacterium]|nr:hypothetical protein [Polyangiaceae bacterium]